jgi:hypothetical protein
VLAVDPVEDGRQSDGGAHQSGRYPRAFQTEDEGKALSARGCPLCAQRGGPVRILADFAQLAAEIQPRGGQADLVTHRLADDRQLHHVPMEAARMMDRFTNYRQ